MATATTGFNHSLANKYTTQAGTVSDTIETINGDGEANIDDTVPATTNNYEVDVTVPVANVISMVLWGAAACTVKTNTTTGVDVFTLAASHPVVWNRNSAITLPLTADVTKLFIDNPGTNPVRVRMSVLLTAHPA